MLTCKYTWGSQCSDVVSWYKISTGYGPKRVDKKVTDLDFQLRNTAPAVEADLAKQAGGSGPAPGDTWLSVSLRKAGQFSLGSRLPLSLASGDQCAKVRRFARSGRGGARKTTLYYGFKR